MLKYSVAILAGAISLTLSGSLFAKAPAPEFIQFKPSATKGAFYRPDPEAFPSAHIGVLVMHRDSNFMSHISTKELSNRGFFVLGMNPRCDNNEAACAPWENNALDIKSGVNFLRSQEGIKNIVLLGHSGGGSTMSNYQAIAENGPEYCQDKARLSPCGDGFENLPKADAVILMDSHPGITINAVRSLNGAVINDSDIMNHNAEPVLDPTLDPFSAENGYSPEGAKYSPEFIKRYSVAQAERMNRLIDIAQQRLELIKKDDLGDAPFIVPMGDGARLMNADVSIHQNTLKPARLLKNDKTIVDDKVVETNRIPSLRAGDAKKIASTIMLTVKSFLSVRAIHATDSMDGIDWCSSNNSTPCGVAQMSVPLLVTAMGSHYFVRDNEEIFDAAASEDKEFIVVEGATHGGTTCTKCEATPGQYSNVTENLFNHMASWMNARF